MAVSNPTLSQIGQAISDMLPKLKPVSFPTGMIAYSHEVPDGWLQCNGAAVSRTTYAALFAVIGTKYGSGNGSTTFNLPNIHRRFIEGTTSASEVADTVSAGLPDISGRIGSDRNATNGNPLAWARSGAFTGVTEQVSGRHSFNHYTTFSGSILEIDFDAYSSDSTYGRSSTVQPKALRLFAIIKA